MDNRRKIILSGAGVNEKSQAKQQGREQLNMMEDVGGEEEMGKKTVASSEKCGRISLRNHPFRSS
jgi:hypothetical protein